MKQYRVTLTEDGLPALARELLEMKVDLIIPVGSPAALAAKAATSTIAIVFNSSDPLAAGLVSSLARPGGNLTGTTNYVPQLTAKKLQLLREAIPGAGRVAYFFNADNPTQTSQEVELQEAARGLGLELQKLEVRAAAELEAAVGRARDGRAEALYVPAESLVFAPERALSPTG